MTRRRPVLAITALLGAVVVLVVALTRGKPDFAIVRGDGSAFPLRGSLADDEGAIQEALEASEFDPDGKVTVLYAGRIEGRGVVIARQGPEVVGLRNVGGKGWKVGEERNAPSSWENPPIVVDGALLLPSDGWERLPLPGDDAQVADGLVLRSGALLSRRPPATLVVQTREPGPRDTSSLFHPEAGVWRLGRAEYRTVRDAARRPADLAALHGAIAAARHPNAPNEPTEGELLWIGDAGGETVAVAGGTHPWRIGLGRVDDPEDEPSTQTLGSRPPLMRKRTDDAAVAATYLRSGELVAVAAGDVERLEIHAGGERLSRPGPVAVVRPTWDVRRTDAVVFGRTASGATVAPLTVGDAHR